MGIFLLVGNKAAPLARTVTTLALARYAGNIYIHTIALMQYLSPVSKQSRQVSNCECRDIRGNADTN